MGTKTSSNANPIYSNDEGNSSVFIDSVAVATTDLDSGDIVKLVKVAAGSNVHRVTVKNTDLDANVSPALTAKIGFSPIDGSAAPSGADTAVTADGAWGQSAATTTYEIFPPYRVEKDSWLTIVIGTVAATQASGTIYAKVEVEALGVK